MGYVINIGEEIEDDYYKIECGNCDCYGGYYGYGASVHYYKKHNKNRSIYESLSDLSDEQLIKIIGKKYESIIHKKIIEVGLEEISGLLSGVFNFSGSGLGGLLLIYKI